MDNPESIITMLENAPCVIVPLVREVPAEVLRRRPHPAKWSVHEHACHLAEVQPMFLSRLELILNDPQPRITPYNPSADDEDGALLKIDLNGALDAEDEIVVMCHHGVRSAQVCAYLAAQGFTKMVNLAGGIERWSWEVDRSVPRY